MNLLLLLPLALVAASPKSAIDPGPPPAAKRPIVHEYHGAKVVDDYEWLENGSDPEVRGWSDAQNQRARSVLDRLPGREDIRRRVTELMTSQPPAYHALQYRGGQLFSLKVQPPKQQPLLVVLPSADDPAKERVLLDPMTLDSKGTTTIDWYVASFDGKKVAVSLSTGGTESGDVHVYDVATGKELGDVVPGVNSGTAGGSLAWTADGTGFYFTRHPREGERPPEDRHFFQQVYFHKLGTPAAQDRYEIGKDFPRIAESELRASEDGKWILDTVQNGDGNEFSLYLRNASGTWSKLADYKDRIIKASFGYDDALYLVSTQGAPRGKVLRLPLASPALDKAREVVPEGDGVIKMAVATQRRLWVLEVLGGPSRLRLFDLEGHAQGPVPILPESSVGGLVRLGGDDVLFANQSYTTPLAWYRASGADGKVSQTGLKQQAVADFSDVEVLSETATSKDGTKVPLTILRLKGTVLDGKNPTLLTGYGGFAITLSPGFSQGMKVWLEQGGVLAISHLRGGGELGEAWHTGGNLTRKQNVFDDFYACAKRLFELKYTRPERLIIEGGSNGGLLMGAALTQHPEAYKAVVSHVGIYDMLRVELAPNGAFNTVEYGSVKDPEQFKALYAYSPYHHVVKGTKYPAILFLTGANDPRVDPLQSRKMVAKLLASNGSKAPILLRTSAGGHGIGSALSERIEQEVDVYSFIFNQLGMKYRPVAPANAVEKTGTTGNAGSP